MAKSSLKGVIAAGLTAMALTYGCQYSNNYVIKPQQAGIVSHDEAIKRIEELVLSEAVNNKVLMLGERHPCYKKDNDFTINIIPRLKGDGFEYLALEMDRNPSDERLIDKLIADYVSGNLKRESISQEDEKMIEASIPGWLDLIDAAKATGMKVVCYDAKSEDSSQGNRDLHEFQNLKGLIFENDSSARVIVYCGAMHLSKKAVRKYNGVEVKMLGFHLTEYTKGKTLAVSLAGETYIIEHCDIITDLDKGTAKYANIKGDKNAKRD